MDASITAGQRSGGGSLLTWLLFCDESGHDHKNTPLEVRGGVAFSEDRIGPFSVAFEDMKLDTFGREFVARNPELKGSSLLADRKFRFAEKEQRLSDNERIKGINRLLESQEQNANPPARGFSALGQASLLFVDRLFSLLEQHKAVLFASAIPRGIRPPPNYEFSDYLRKDSVFLQERFFYFLEERDSSGLMVFDQTETQQDKRYIRRLREYYTRTENRRERAERICPMPLFVDSELSPCMQAADICLYCVNWGFRRSEWAFAGPRRDNLAQRYAGRCGNLQYQGTVWNKGKSHPTYGIIFVPDPYLARL